MKILIIGGGVFLGRALIDAGLANGHRITTFTRGNSELPRSGEIDCLTGDRHGDLSSINGRDWDAVIDTCAYRPEEVTSLFGAIGVNTAHYTLISSASAYADPTYEGLSENSPLRAPLPNPGKEITGDNYGPLKAEAESAAAAFSNRLIVRPGIIAGPYDPTDRITYWINCVEHSERILVPAGLPSCSIQLIDVRDLASWIMAQIEFGVSGIFNTVGPEKPIIMGEMLHGFARGWKREIELVEIDAESLSEIGVNLESDFPLHIPEDSKQRALFKVDGSKAWASGLVHRPISETARDTGRWFNEHRSCDLRVGWPVVKMKAALRKLT